MLYIVLYHPMKRDTDIATLKVLILDYAIVEVQYLEPVLKTATR